MPGPYRAAARKRVPTETPPRFHIPIRRAGCPHPAAASRRRQHPGRDESLHYSPCLPPWGKVAPQGRMRGRFPPPPFPGQTAGGGVPDAPRRLALPPTTTLAFPLGGRWPRRAGGGAGSRHHPFPGKPQGAASPTPRGGLRRRPSPGYHPRRLPLPPTPAEGSRPLPTDRTIDGCPRNPPGRACPAPTA